MLIPGFQLSSGSLDLVVPIYASADLEQSYDQIGGFSSIRMLGGSLRRQKSWKRLMTDITGRGTIPPALSELDETLVWTMKCVAPRAASDEDNVITVPVYRSDVTPQGYAILSSGLLEPTAISWASQVATLTVVTGAIGYRVKYWPQLTVICDPIKEAVNVRGSEYGWSLHAEEI